MRRFISNQRQKPNVKTFHFGSFLKVFQLIFIQNIVSISANSNQYRPVWTHLFSFMLNLFRFQCSIQLESHQLKNVSFFFSADSICVFNQLRHIVQSLVIHSNVHWLSGWCFNYFDLATHTYYKLNGHFHKWLRRTPSTTFFFFLLLQTDFRSCICCL